MLKIREPAPGFGIESKCRKNDKSYQGPCLRQSPKINSEKKEEKINKIVDFPLKFFNKIDGNVNTENDDQINTKKKQIKKILKEQNFTGKEIKSALRISKCDVNKAINLLMDMK